MGVSGQLHTPAKIYPQERTAGTHCTEGWVGPRAGLDTDERKYTFASAGDRMSMTRSSSDGPEGPKHIVIG
jgi:hypothetical protein